MASTKANYEAIEVLGGALQFLRDELGCENLAVSVLKCDHGWTGTLYDHAEEGQEAVPPRRWRSHRHRRW